MKGIVLRPYSSSLTSSWPQLLDCSLAKYLGTKPKEIRLSVAVPEPPLGLEPPGILDEGPAVLGEGARLQVRELD